MGAGLAGLQPSFPAAGSVRPIITLGLPSPQPYGVHSFEPALKHRVILWFVPGL